VFLEGLGFYPQSKKNGISKPHSTITEKQLIEKSKQPIVTCFYCMKSDHSIRFCKIRKFYVPKGIKKWIPKVFKVPTNIIGPKFIRGPNLAS